MKILLNKQNILKNLVYLIFTFFIVGRQVLPLESQYMLLILFLLLFTLKIVGKKKRIIINDLMIITWFIVLILVNLLSLLYVDNIGLTLSYINYFILGIIIYLITTMTVKNSNNILRFIISFIVLNAVISLITTISYFIFVLTGIDSLLLSTNSVGARGHGFYGNPNYFSVSLILSIGLLMGLKDNNWFYPKNHGNLFYILFLILALGLFVSFSRGAWLSTVIMFIIFFFKFYRYILTPKVFLIVPLVIGASYFFIKDYVDLIIIQIDSRLNDAFITNGGSGRYATWIHGWDLFISDIKYMILGVGGNQFRNFNEYIVHHPHNGYLSYLYQNGIIGFSFLITLLVWMFVKIKKSEFFWVLFIPFIGLLVMSLTNDIFVVSEFWLLLGLVGISTRLPQKN